MTEQSHDIDLTYADITVEDVPVGAEWQLINHLKFYSHMLPAATYDR